VRERARAKGVSLSLEVDQDAEEIEADARKLRQVVFNLLANAVRFTPSGGAVAVTARRAPGQVEIAVADTGVGIAPADQERVFGEFEQAGPPGERQGGTGLGLALARRLVELHGGRILLESAPGRGSTFTVVLPQPPRPATPSLPAPPPMATGA
jgi:signal transduction histidine kinase